VSDIDRNRKPDLFWQNDADRSATVWFMGGPDGIPTQGWAWLTTFNVRGWTLR